MTFSQAPKGKIPILTPVSFAYILCMFLDQEYMEL